MRITVCAVGRMRDRHQQALLNDYLDRASGLGRSLGVTEISVREVEAKPATSDREAQAILSAVPDGAYLVALDETGKTQTSRNFAQWLATLKDSGERDLVFVIGGADGIGAAVMERTREKLSFGPMTWPHMLARIFLVEQLYRAISILAGHPYHRD